MAAGDKSILTECGKSLEIRGKAAVGHEDWLRYPAPMWWWGKQKPLRGQLLEARDKVQRQLEVLYAGNVAGDMVQWQPGTVDELRNVLAEINKSLAELDADQAKGSESA
ncbi:MAG TPA: hypothetical protein VGR79_08250 [Stellaceae bacterium]|nr:hypothetical protein [Stellaceae bacterium]